MSGFIIGSEDVVIRLLKNMIIVMTGRERTCFFILSLVTCCVTILIVMLICGGLVVCKNILSIALVCCHKKYPLGLSKILPLKIW